MERLRNFRPMVGYLVTRQVWMPSDGGYPERERPYYGVHEIVSGSTCPPGTIVLMREGYMRIGLPDSDLMVISDSDIIGVFEEKS